MSSYSYKTKAFWLGEHIFLKHTQASVWSKFLLKVTFQSSEENLAYTLDPVVINMIVETILFLLYNGKNIHNKPSLFFK